MSIENSFELNKKLNIQTRINNDIIYNRNNLTKNINQNIFNNNIQNNTLNNNNQAVLFVQSNINIENKKKINDNNDKMNNFRIKYLRKNNGR